MNKKQRTALVEDLKVVQAGVKKLAELSIKSASADEEALVSRANAIASKMASMGIGNEHDVPANTEAFKRDHNSALACTEHLLDYVSTSVSKEASFGGGLGSPAGPTSKSSATSGRKAYKPPRC